MLDKKYERFSGLVEEYNQIKEREEKLELHERLLSDLEDSLKDIQSKISKFNTYQELLSEYGGEFRFELDLGFSLYQEDFKDASEEEINQEEKKVEETLRDLTNKLEELESQLLDKVESSKRNIQEKLLILNIPSIRKDSDIGDEDKEKLEEINRRLEEFLNNPDKKNAEGILELEKKLDRSAYEGLSWEKVRERKEISKNTQNTLMELFESGSLEITDVSDEVLEDLEKFPKLTENIRINYEG
jgi:hypothetical protein